MKKLNSSSAGISLVEVIVAVVILGIITVPLLHTLVTGARTARKSADAQDANNAAQSLVEQVRALGPDELFINPTKLTGSVLDASSTDTIKKLSIDNYTIGSRNYDAKVTIDASAEDNSVSLSKSNPMDITIDMKYADGKAKNAYQDACKVEVPIYDTDEDGKQEVVGSYFIYPDAGHLRRSSIAVDASRELDGEGKYCYTVTVTFSYMANAYEDYPAYSGTVSSSASVNVAKLPEYGDAAFSVYLIYDAYFRNGDTVTISNPHADADYNVFLVNASKETMPAGFLGEGVKVRYEGQRFSDKETCQRVFANLDSRCVKYDASGFAAGESSINRTISGELVEKTAGQRRYMVTVQLFEQGKSEELISLSAEMLI